MNIFLSLIDVIVPIYLIIGIGFAYGRKYAPDLTTINHLTPSLFFPALFLDRLPGYDYAFSATAALLAAAAIILLLCGALVWPLARLARHDQRAVLVTVMFNNSGNIGLPVALLAFGEAGLQPALLLMVLQTFMNIVGAELVFTGRIRLLPILSSPLMLSMSVGIILGMTGTSLPALISTPLGMLADVAIPLVLFAMGARFASVQTGDLAIGVIYGFARPLSGLIAYLIIRPWFELSPLHADILLVFAVLPPAVFNFLLAERYQYQPRMIASITMLGNLIGFLTLTLAVTWVR